MTMFETKSRAKAKKQGEKDLEGIGAVDGTEVDVKTKSADVDDLLKEAAQAMKKKEPSGCGCGW